MAPVLTRLAHNSALVSISVHGIDILLLQAKLAYNLTSQVLSANTN